MRKVKWGVIGCAGIAKGHTIPGMQLAENCELYAIAGRDFKKAETFKEQFGFQKAYGSYEQLLSDPEVEAVYIPLPNTLHAEWCKKAADAGKHILCEKPLTPSAAETAEVIRYCEEKGVILMEAFAYLHSPLISDIKSRLPELGKLKYLDATFLTSDYDFSNIRMQHACAGGALYDIGCYCTSIITWMLGIAPEKVSALSEFSGDGIDLFTTALLNYSGGLRGVVKSGFVLDRHPFVRLDDFYVSGENGYIRNSSRFNADGELHYTICINGNEETVHVSAPQCYGLEVAQLGRCITDGEKPYVSHEFSIQNAKIMDEIFDKTGYKRA